MIKPLITDLEAIAQLAKEKEDENCEFRSFLKGIDLSEGELDAVVHRHHEEVAGQIDCCSCANCCRQMTPMLQKKDVARLARGLTITRKELEDRFLKTDKEGNVIFTGKPCPMLSDKDNRCTVYEHRPEDCRSYPHLHKKRFVSRLIGTIQNCAICPIAYNVFERLKAELWDESDDDWLDDDFFGEIFPNKE